MTDLAFLLKFAGIPSYDRRISALTGGAGPVAGGVALDDFLEEIADQDAKDAEQDLKLAQMSESILVLGTGIKDYFISAEIGNDDFDGLTEQTPCATFGALFSKMSFANANRINMMTDIVENGAPVSFFNHVNIELLGHGGEDRVLTFSGSGGWSFRAGSRQVFTQVKTVNDKAAGFPISIIGQGGVEYILGEIDRTQTAIDGQDRAVFSLGAFVDFRRISTIIAPAALGKVIARANLQDN